MKTPTVTIETVTPEIAHAWLGENTNNRSVRRRLVTRLAADMANGDWHLNGDAIRFNGTGTLLDGQHRLLACVEAGVPFATLVVRGLASDVIETIDTGAARKLSDALKMRGEAYPSELAAALPVCVAWDLGQLRKINDRPSHSACLAWLAENPEIRSAVQAVADLRKAPVYLSARIAAPFAFRAGDVEPDALNEFLHRLRTGEELSRTDAILHLRNWLFRVHNEGLQPTVYQRMGFLVKAFNYWAAGIDTELLVFRVNERFPEIGSGQSRNARRYRRARGVREAGLHAPLAADDADDL